LPAPPPQFVPADQSTFPLIVKPGQDKNPRQWDRFYTSIASTVDSGRMKQDFGNGATVDMDVDNKQILSLSVDGATSAQLRGGSEKQFMVLAAPANTALVQVSCTPKDNPTSWAWKDQVSQLALIDGSGGRIGPALGAWVKYSDVNGTKVSCRFKFDGTAKVSDLKPAGEVQEVWFVFAVPRGARIDKVVAGQAVLSEQPLDVK
jgi:hypothetical protein